MSCDKWMAIWFSLNDLVMTSNNETLQGVFQVFVYKVLYMFFSSIFILLLFWMFFKTNNPYTTVYNCADIYRLKNHLIFIFIDESYSLSRLWEGFRFGHTLIFLKDTCIVFSAITYVEVVLLWNMMYLSVDTESTALRETRWTDGPGDFSVIKHQVDIQLTGFLQCSIPGSRSILRMEMEG